MGHKHTNDMGDTDPRFEALPDAKQPTGDDSVDSVDSVDEPNEGVTSFVPTDYYGGQSRKRGMHRSERRRAIIALVIILGVVALAIGVGYAYTVLTNPSALFSDAATPSPSPKPGVVIESEPRPEILATPSPSPTIDPYQIIYEQADLSMMQNIVNVLVIGVDYAEERETWIGKHEYHADVMMVLAINFDENRVDLISLPRDTYAKIPGVKGIYKLNASINCGGGMDAEGGAGFLKTCEAASWMLGGIPVNYYYAVTMPAVKELVNIVGGVDYDLELDFTMVGRTYRKGQQHMDGQAVLDYLRVRKNVSTSGDWNRVNRQKMMMIALFQSMQQQNLILKIPEIISSFQGQLYTNCSAAQTAALTAFAYKLSGDNIGMYSMKGSTTSIFGWNFCLTDQTNRVEVVKSVYGVDVPRYLEYTADYAEFRWADMLATQYLKTVRGLTKHVSAEIDADNLLPEGGSDSSGDASGDVSGDVSGGESGGGESGGGESGGDGFDVLPPEGTSANIGTGFSVVRLGAGFSHPPVSAENGDGETGMRRYSEADRQLFSDYLNALDALESSQKAARAQAEKYVNGSSNSLRSKRQELSDDASRVKSCALELAQTFGYSTSKFNWTYNYWVDSDFNEVKVDFR